MKHIVKSSCPRELTQWIRIQGDINCRYEYLPSDIRAIIKQRLIEDQGYICGYTGIRINNEHSHIEHLKPQSRYVDNQEDLDYTNLIAAYPGVTAPQCAYGAHPKADWYDEAQFINPTHAHCETAFKFTLSGKITASPHNLAAQTTIERLNLTHPSLTEMREQAIQELLFEHEISLKQAKEMLEKMYERNTKGQFRQFCFVLKQACTEYIRRKEQNKTRQQAVRNQAKQKP